MTVSGETVETAKYSQGELLRLFGDRMPVEVVNLLFDAPGDMTLGQIRERIAEMAVEWSSRRQTKTANEVIVDYLRVLDSMSGSIDICFVDMAVVLRERLNDHGFVIVPRVATCDMVIGARNWAYSKNNRPITDNVSVGCWNSMVKAATGDRL